MGRVVGEARVLRERGVEQATDGVLHRRQVAQLRQRDAAEQAVDRVERRRGAAVGAAHLFAERDVGAPLLPQQDRRYRGGDQQGGADAGGERPVARDEAAGAHVPRQPPRGDRSLLDHGQQVVGERGGARVAARALDVERGVDDQDQLGRGATGAQRTALAGEDRLAQSFGLVEIERRLQAEQAVQQGPEAVDVGAFVGALAAHLLGRHVRRRTGRRARTRQARVVLRLREAEVEHDGAAVVGQHHVRRLQVAMEHAARVRVLDAERDLVHQLRHHEPPWTAREPAAIPGVDVGRREQPEQVVAGEPARFAAAERPHHRLGAAAPQARHRVPRHAVDVAGREDRHDRRVLEAGDGVDLAAEALAGAFEQQQLGSHDLQRHLAAERRLLGEVHDAHAPFAERAEDPELAEHARRPGRGRDLLELAQVRDCLAQPRRVFRVRIEEPFGSGATVPFEPREGLGQQRLQPVGALVRVVVRGVQGAPDAGDTVRSDMSESSLPLVTRALARNQEAVEQLLVQHLPGLRAWLRLRMGPGLRARETPDDLVQSVAREVLLGLDAFEWRGESAFRHWLYLKAQRKLVDKARFVGAEQRTPAKERDLDALASGVVAGLVAESPSHAAIGAEDVQRIEAAFAELPGDWQEAVSLHKLCGMAVPEIAVRMQRSEGAVRNLIWRGLSRLALRIGDLRRADQG